MLQLPLQDLGADVFCTLALRLTAASFPSNRLQNNNDTVLRVFVWSPTLVEPSIANKTRAMFYSFFGHDLRAPRFSATSQ